MMQTLIRCRKTSEERPPCSGYYLTLDNYPTANFVRINCLEYSTVHKMFNCTDDRDNEHGFECEYWAYMGPVLEALAEERNDEEL